MAWRRRPYPSFSRLAKTAPFIFGALVFLIFVSLGVLGFFESVFMGIILGCLCWGAIFFVGSSLRDGSWRIQLPLAILAIGAWILWRMDVF